MNDQENLRAVLGVRTRRSVLQDISNNPVQQNDDEPSKKKVKIFLSIFLRD